MKQHVQKLYSRWQQYTARERTLLLFCTVVLGCTAFYYGAWQPLMLMNKHSQQTLKRQQETLMWMRDEIDSKHIPVRKVKTANVPNLVEISARELNIPLLNMNQQGTGLTFSVAQIDMFQLKNWLREINLSSGAQVQKLTLTPVDSASKVRAEVQLHWNTEK